MILLQFMEGGNLFNAGTTSARSSATRPVAAIYNMQHDGLQRTSIGSFLCPSDANHAVGLLALQLRRQRRRPLCSSTRAGRAPSSSTPTQDFTYLNIQSASTVNDRLDPRRHQQHRPVQRGLSCGWIDSTDRDHPGDTATPTSGKAGLFPDDLQRRASLDPPPTSKSAPSTPATRLSRPTTACAGWRPGRLEFYAVPQLRVNYAGVQPHGSTASCTRRSVKMLDPPRQAVLGHLGPRRGFGHGAADQQPPGRRERPLLRRLGQVHQGIDRSRDLEGAGLDERRRGPLRDPTIDIPDVPHQRRARTWQHRSESRAPETRS